MYVKQTSTSDVISHAPIRLENGRMALRECRPKLHFEKPTTRYNKTLETPHDIENRLRYTLELIKITQDH